jgi:hypothetical protein
MLHRTRARDRGTLAAAAAGALAAAVVVSATIDPRDPEPVRVRAADRAGERRLGNGSEAGRAALRDRPRAYAARERVSRSRRVRKTGRRERR